MNTSLKMWSNKLLLKCDETATTHIAIYTSRQKSIFKIMKKKQTFLVFRLRLLRVYSHIWCSTDSDLY